MSVFSSEILYVIRRLYLMMLCFRDYFGERQKPQRYSASFNEHLEGQLVITVNLVGGIQAHDLSFKCRLSKYSYV